jgi:hypothetical protein
MSLKLPLITVSRRFAVVAALCAGALIFLLGGAGRSTAAVAAPSPAETAPAPAPETEKATVAVTIASPLVGALVESKIHIAPVRGTASSGDDEWKHFDVMIALDVSFSTRDPSGIDIDDDGETGFNPDHELVMPGTYPDGTVNTDPDDSILAAEISAALLLLDELDSSRTRIGLVTFSGKADPITERRASFDQQDAWVRVPLTHDFDEIRAELAVVLSEGPQHATDFAAAIRLSVNELVGMGGAKSTPREAKRVVLFLTDGLPSFPYGRGSVADPEDTEAAISAAKLANAAGITINSFALGKQALARPVAATEIARITSGSYTPVRNPGEIVQFLNGISFANVDDVVITNLTLREVSYDVSLAPDGTFSGFVPVKLGTNEIQVTALASDGTEASTTVEFEFQEAGLTELETARELERIKGRNKSMLKLLERERIQRFRERRREVVIEEDRGE